MANQLQQNPWQLDGSVLNQILILNNIKIKNIEFAGYVNGPASSVVLGDRFGNVVWRATGAADNSEVRTGNVGWIDGLQELIHTDGFVLVYFE